MRIDEGSASCLVHTFKEGMLSAVAHDLEIRVGRFTITIDEPPGDGARSLVATFDATSLRVVGAVKDGAVRAGTLGDGDRRKIEQTIEESVLQGRRWPEVRYVVASLPALDGWREGTTGPLRLDGRLTLCGVERALACEVRREGDSAVTEVEIHQPDFGIRPYSAALGTLRIRPSLRVRVAVPLASLSTIGKTGA